MRSPLKIAIDLRPLLTPFESGVTVYTKEMVRAFLAMPEVQVELFYQARRRCQKIHDIFPSARHIPLSNTLFHLKWMSGFRALPVGYFVTPPDLIFIPDRRPFYTLDIPLFMTVHDSVPEDYSWTLSLKSLLWHKIFPLKNLIKMCSGILVPSLTVRTELSRFSLPKEVTYEGATLAKKMEKPEMAEEILKRPFFLAISPMDPRKRLEWIYKSAEKFPKMNFVIAGIKKGDKRFTSKLLNGFLLKKSLKNLIFLEEITEGEKLWLLKNAVALLALSKYEGFDLPVLEAVKARCPVVMSDIAVHNELYKSSTQISSLDELFVAIYVALHGNAKIPVQRGKYSWELSAKRALLFFLRVLVNKN